MGFMVNEKMKGRINFSTVGIALGILVVVVSIIWVAILNLGRNKYSGNEIMWVG